jgi:hypothetical protein
MSMKKIFLVPAFLGIAMLMSAQTITVTYDRKFSRLQEGSKEKVQVPTVDENGNVISIDSMFTKDILGKMSIGLESVVTTDGVHYKMMSRPKAPGMIFNGSDSVTYRDGQWQSYTDGERTVHASVDPDFEKQGSVKEILGYQCELYLTKHPLSGATLMLWVTTKLTPMVTPMPGMLAPGGVLEIKEITGRWTVTASSISK